MTTKNRILAMERAIGQSATTPRKTAQEMSDEELMRIIGAPDGRELSDDELLEIIERNEP